MQLKYPLVSVIIPNYNHARYLKQRLDSVFDQTYQNFEVIILDDCSTDNSLEVIEHYKDNPHLSQIVVNEVNSGSPFKQWNKGFQYAKGELIWIAESDDFCELNFLREMVSACSIRDNVALAFSSYVWYFEETDTYCRPKLGGVDCYSGVRFIKTRMVRECFIHNASGVVFRKDLLDNLSDDYIHFKQCGDYMFWTLLCGCGRVVAVNHNLSYYRLHNSSVTSQNEQSGISALEDKEVFDYITRRYHLSLFQKQVAYASKYKIYTESVKFSSDELKKKALQNWGINGRNERIDSFLLWLVGSVNRHFGLLI